MKNNLKNNLEEIRRELKLSTEAKDRMANFVMSEVESGVQSKKPKVAFGLRLLDVFVPAKNLIYSPGAVFSLVVALFLVTSFASINASKNSLPGDPLYPVKITAENLKYSLTFNDEGKIKASASMARSRATELRLIVHRGSNNENDLYFNQTAEQIRNNLDEVKNKLHNLRNSEADKVLATAKEIDAELNGIKKEIEASQKDADKESQDEIGDVINDVEEASSVVLAVMAEKVEANSVMNVGGSETDIQVELENIKTRIKNELEVLEERISLAKEVGQNEDEVGVLIANEIEAQDAEENIVKLEDVARAEELLAGAKQSFAENKLLESVVNLNNARRVLVGGSEDKIVKGESDETENEKVNKEEEKKEVVSTTQTSLNTVNTSSASSTENNYDNASSTSNTEYSQEKNNIELVNLIKEEMKKAEEEKENVEEFKVRIGE